MARAVVRPYLTPDGDRFEAQIRLAIRPGDHEVDEHDGGIVRGWDPNTPTSVRVRLHSDLPGALADMMLDDGSMLGASLWWKSTRTGLRGVATTVTVQNATTSFTADLSPDRLGGQLTVGVDVHLVESRGGQSLSPDRVAQKLWSTQESWLLEGVGERFPIEVVDFRTVGMRGPDGAWALHWYQRDPTAPVSAAVRLRLNRTHPLASRLNGTDESHIAHSVLRRDIIRELADAACEMPGFEIDTAGWPPGSLGNALSVLLAGVMPGFAVADLRAMREVEPDNFESWIQELTGFLREEQPRA